MQKYSLNQYPIEIVLGWVTSGEIAIPEIQRPFVWDSSKVRDFRCQIREHMIVGEDKN